MQEKDCWWIIQSLVMWYCVAFVSWIQRYDDAEEVSRVCVWCCIMHDRCTLIACIPMYFETTGASVLIANLRMYFQSDTHYPTKLLNCLTTATIHSSLIGLQLLSAMMLRQGTYNQSHKSHLARSRVQALLPFTTLDEPCYVDEEPLFYLTLHEMGLRILFMQ